MSFDYTAMLVDQSAVANGTVTINTALTVNGKPSTTYMFANKTPFEGYPIGVKVNSATSNAQCVLTVQESVDGTTALAGGNQLVITVTGAQGYKASRWVGSGLAQYIIGTAVVTNGPITDLEIGWALNDSQLP